MGDLVNIIIVPFSFLVAYFVKDITMIVNHKLILYRMSSLLSRIEQRPFSFIVFRPRYLLFRRIYESHKDRPKSSGVSRSVKESGFQEEDTERLIENNNNFSF